MVKDFEVRGCVLPIFGSKVFKEERRATANALRKEADILKDEKGSKCGRERVCNGEKS